MKPSKNTKKKEPTPSEPIPAAKKPRRGISQAEICPGGGVSRIPGLRGRGGLGSRLPLDDCCEEALGSQGIHDRTAPIPRCLDQPCLEIDGESNKIHDCINESYANLLKQRPESSPTPSPTTLDGAASLDALMAAVPEGATLSEVAPMLAEISRECRGQIAARLQPALNAHLQAMPHDDYEGKKEVARLANSEAERFGLAVKCPKTGLPAKLRAQTGNWPGIGRFAFEVYVDGKRSTPSASDKLPELELIDVNAEVSPEVPWQEKVGPKADRPGRRRT